MKTKWALNELKQYQGTPLVLNGQVQWEDSLKKRHSEILSVSPINISGTIEMDESSVMYVDLVIDTTLTLPSARSLEPVETLLHFTFSEIYIAPDSNVSLEQFTEGEIVDKLSENSLNLKKPIEDAVLTNIPTQVFTQAESETEELPSGKDWHVIAEDSYGEEDFSSSEEGDPRFAALKDLFQENDN